MKTSIAFAILLFGVVSVVNVANAQSSYSIVETENFMARFTQIPGAAKIRILVIKPAGNKFWITVRDSLNYPVCYLEMPRRETQRFFMVDMNEMPNGKYTFELETGKLSLTSKLSVVRKTVIKEKTILAQPIVGEQFVFSN